MIINGKNIVGLYKYNSESTFTEGDIVYKDSVLYIAKTEVSGIDPSDELMSKGKYEIYLGDKCIGIDDYLNYEKTEDSKIDKYITADLLPVILNHYMTGVTDKGIISSLDESVSVDDIIDNQNINNAVYSVDRCQEGLPLDVYSSSFNRMNKERLILKQYTYTEKEFINSIQEIKRVRVQELIDHSQGMVWYRYKKIDNIQSNSSNWKSITLNTTNIHENILNLSNTYKNMIDRLRETLLNIKRNFRFKSLELSKKRGNSFIIPDEYIESIITLVVLKRVGNGIYEPINLTIDLGSTISKYESKDCYVYINKDEKKITLYEDKDMTIPNRKSFINEIYIHEYYE